MLAFTDTEIEQTLRNARLLFEQLDKVLECPTEATEKYRLNIEELVKVYREQNSITTLKRNIERQYEELNKLL